MGVQSILFKAGCKYYNWRNGTSGAGSSDTQSLQNSEEGGSTSQPCHNEPLKPEIWQKKTQEQLMLPFKPSRFREKSAWGKPLLGESDEDRRKRLYGMRPGQAIHMKDVYGVGFTAYDGRRNIDTYPDPYACSSVSCVDTTSWSSVAK